MKDHAKLRIGLVIDMEFHLRDGWVVALTPELVRAMMDRFDCRIITSQKEYLLVRDEVDALVSMEPGWAAPKINFRKGRAGRKDPPLSYILYSDPHEARGREEYFIENRLGFVLALYDAPTRRHFRKIPADRILYFPWAVPELWIGSEPIRFRGRASVACFGAGNHEAYAVRNWCRGFEFVDSTTHSGVEDKQYVGRDYMDWLGTMDAAIAAGSDDPTYRLTMPKYFEIPAAGALLFAQETDDLEKNGFVDGENCVVFNRGNFEARARAYLADPESYLPLREAGRELIRKRHTVARRLDYLERHIREHL